MLVSNRLGDLARARTLAKKALRVVRQNLVWAALYNAACVPLALIGWLQWAFAAWTHGGYWRRREAKRVPPSLPPSPEDSPRG